VAATSVKSYPPEAPPARVTMVSADLRAKEEALRRVATLVAGDAPPAEIFTSVSEETARLVGADSGGVAAFEAGSARFVGRWDAAGDVTLIPVGTVVPLSDDSTVSRVYRTGRPARIDDYWRLEGETAESVRAAGFLSVASAPVAVSGTLWGAITVGSMGDRLPDETEERLLDFAELVSLAVSSAEAWQRVLESRQRIVEAGDAERLRLGRNLHDGAQQRLISVILLLRLGKRQLGDGGDPAELIDRAIAEAQQAHDEIRDLARGLSPTALSEVGLGPALRALLQHSPLPVELDIVPERFPESIEAAAYYVIAEAVTNAGKHSRANRVAARVTARPESLEIEVTDDGIGGARPDGSGLHGLSDRVEAIGGQLHLESEPGRGTSLRATLPLPNEQGAS
jgi:signal transduction histidine kinase